MLASQIVERAYREAAIKAIGEPLSAGEYQEGLDRLNGFIMSLFGGEIGQVLKDWPVPDPNPARAANHIHLPYPLNLDSGQQPGAPVVSPLSESVFHPPANSRVLWAGTSAGVLNMPLSPVDGTRMAFVSVGATAALTISGNGRMVNGSPSVPFNPGDPPRLFFYRADLADWVPVAVLGLSDPHPLPPEFDELLVAGTAIRLTALDEISPQSGTMFIFDRLMARLKQRYYQPGTAAPNVIPLRSSVEAFNPDGWM